MVAGCCWQLIAEIGHEKVQGPATKTTLQLLWSLTGVVAQTENASLQTKSCKLKCADFFSKAHLYFDEEQSLFQVCNIIHNTRFTTPLWLVFECLQTSWHLLRKLSATTVICSQPKQLQDGLWCSTFLATDFTWQQPVTSSNYFPTSRGTHIFP